MIIFAFLIIVIIAVFFIFVAVILFGAPYVPTLSAQRKVALDILDLKEGQTLYELGSGDGNLLIEAAERGINAVGYELNPLLVLLSRRRARKYGDKIRVVWGNFWNADFSKADAIFVFQMDRSMKNLESKIDYEVRGRPFKVASHAFQIPGKKPAAKKDAIFLYEFNNRR